MNEPRCAAESRRPELLSRRESLLALGGTAAYFGLFGAAPAAAPSRRASGSSAADWRRLSNQFAIESGLAYLNTGSLGASPAAVLDAVRSAAARIETNPVAMGFGAVLGEAEAARSRFAELFGCSVDEVCLTNNTTDGMNLVAEGLDLKSGDHVLTSNHEHGGGSRCWQFLAKRRGVIIDVAEVGAPPQSEDEVVERFRAALTPQTRVISVSHVTFSSGVQLPIARLAELAHQHSCLLVADGAQSAGAIPVNVKALGCDAYATSGHKWLLGSKGSGLLYISETARDAIAPMRLDDGPGVYTAIGGTTDSAAVLGLAAAVDWAAKIGRDAIFGRIRQLRDQLYAELEATPGVRINSPPPGSPMASQMVCFTIADRDRLPQVHEQFARDKIVVKTVHHGGIDFRVGCHVYNSEEDVSRFGASLRKALA